MCENCEKKGKTQRVDDGSEMNGTSLCIECYRHHQVIHAISGLDKKIQET